MLTSGMAPLKRQISLLKLLFSALAVFYHFSQQCGAYFDTYICFGTPQGDCQIYTYMQEGGFNDPNYRWLMECQDQEALFGIYDNFHNFESITHMWCKNMFPLKPPSLGSYPYYPYCTYRDLTSYEHYCFDWRAPLKTYDTFVTGFYDPIDEEVVIQPVGVKCCRTPLGYHIVYPACYYKYTHDQHGEHFDGYWLTICDDAFHVIVGVGQALNPWDREIHFVWIMCCPIVYAGDVDSRTFIGTLTTKFGALDAFDPVAFPTADGGLLSTGSDGGALANVTTTATPSPPQNTSAVARHAPIPHDADITEKYGYAGDEAHNMQFPDISLPSAVKVDKNRLADAFRAKRLANHKQATTLNQRQQPKVMEHPYRNVVNVHQQIDKQKLSSGNEFVVKKHAEADKPPKKAKTSQILTEPEETQVMPSRLQ